MAKLIFGVNDLATTHPVLAREWHPAKNGDFTPAQVTAGSAKKIWWQCANGHEWQAEIRSRACGGYGCPVCAGQVVVEGFNDLLTLNPALAAEWHPVKNEELKPTKVAACSRKKVWWLGKCGHEWQATVASRKAGNGCPICAGKVVLCGFNDLTTVNPRLAAEWHPTKNNGLLPSQITPSASQKVWWLGQCGHEWQATAFNRSSGNGCPICCGKQVLRGCNDLATTHPELAAEWHPTKNGNLTPVQITSGSNKKAWWKCEKGHEWQATVASRRYGNNCPICSGHKVLPGYNDLATFNSKLADEWHPTKNGNLKPSMVAVHSMKKVWWLGKCGHEWNAEIDHRSRGQGCPLCLSEKKTSFPEQAIFFYLNQLTPAKSRYLLNGKTEIDIYLPEYRVGIEYDGGFYHKGLAEKEKQKDELVRAADITLIRVKETETSSGYCDTDNIIFCEYSATHRFLNDVLIKLLAQLNILAKKKFVLDIDIERDRPQIYDLYIQNVKENSLELKMRDIASQWHPTKNGHLQPSQVTIGSNKKVWWVCEKGHEWQSTINNRRQGNGCPICSGQKVLPGYNDLATVNPQLAAEWHPTKNGDLTPEQVTTGSGKKVWWQCEHGHEWDAKVSDRSHGRGCPYCGSRKLLPGFNDLKTKFPCVAKEWHPTKNGNLLPSQVMPGTNKKVWWLCSICGHEWQTTPNSRALLKTKCPACARKRANVHE